MQIQRYRSLATYLRTKYGKRIQKIPLDVGSTCPNRDGTMSRHGCVFCSPLGTGTGLHAQRMSMIDQWSYWTSRFAQKHKNVSFWAYLQSFSNTYGPLQKLRGHVRELALLPGMELVSLGTRPDCLDKDKLRCIAELDVSEIWLDIGLQTSNDTTLRRINRGHDFACFARCVDLAHRHGLHVCAHVIHGLPGEATRDFLETIRRVNALPIAGIKFHNLFVARGSTLEQEWREGNYRPGPMVEYIQAVSRGLQLLRPEILIHRLNADPSPGELLAPDWAAQKTHILEAIRRNLDTMNAYQGGQACQTSSSGGGSSCFAQKPATFENPAG